MTDLIILLLSLSKSFPRPDFNGATAVAELRRDSRFSEAKIANEDLKAGKNLLTTLELTLRQPWQTDLASLQSTFGDQFRWLPRPPGLGGHRILQFELKTSPLKSVVMLTVLEEEGQKVSISEMMLRRFYPSGFKSMTRSEAEQAAIAELKRQNPEDAFILIGENTVERPFGWVFFFKTKEAIPGFGPVAVERESGLVHCLRPSPDVNRVISEFERGLK